MLYGLIYAYGTPIRIWSKPKAHMRTGYPVHIRAIPYAYGAKFWCVTEYLDHALCGCHLFYNSLVFNPILLSFGRGSLPCLVHLHSNFQLIPLCSLCDIGGYYRLFNYAKSIVQFLPRLD